MEKTQDRVRGIKKSMYMCEFFIVKNFSSTTFSNKNLNTRNVFFEMYVNYTKNLQAKYFTGENIPIYGIGSNLGDSGL